MKLLLDSPAKYYLAAKSRFDFVGGQLLSPTTARRRAYVGDAFAIDNGAFSGFQEKLFFNLLARNKEHRPMCLWVVAPDIVANGRRTLELFDHFFPMLEGWPPAIAIQDGMEDLPIPWGLLRGGGVFLGGSTEFKESQAAIDILKTARAMGFKTHVGRINTPKRWKLFEDMADTCDGTGCSRFDWMLDKIAARDFQDTPLLDGCDEPTTTTV